MFDWLQNFADWLIYTIIGIDEASHPGKALNFFVYDSAKILLLLYVIVFFMGIINSYFPVDKVRNYLSKNRLYGTEYIIASLFGAVTPFCSCSSVPLFIGFVRGGIPLGVTFAFLITSPLVNEAAVAVFLGVFGLKATLIYAGFGILLGIAGGWVLGKLKLENLLSEWVKKMISDGQLKSDESEEERLSFVKRLPEIKRNAGEIVRGVVLYVLTGIAIGAAMHGYVPEKFFAEYLGSGSWWTVPLAVILAVPMYANAAGIVPVIQVFVAKGIPVGTAIAFMMATVGLSLPEATLLKKVMSVKLIAIFFGVVTIFIIISGYLFNLIL